MKTELSTALILWLILLAVQLVFIQCLGWIIRWRPRKVEQLSKTLSPRQLLVVGTLCFWVLSLILLRFHSAEAWRIPSYAIVGVSVLLAIPCYLAGRSVATVSRVRANFANSDQVRWTYSAGGLFLATGAVVLPVLVYLLSGADEMLSELCTSMAFVGGTVLPCVLGFIKNVGVHGSRVATSGK